MSIREVDLDHAFADALTSSPELRSRLLDGGRFARHANASRLLHDEQAAARSSARHWWKHWWCGLPDGSQSETDIFLVFEANKAERFALHIENKPAHGTLPFGQARDYRRRAAFKANNASWLNYSDFEVILLAPAAFLRKNTVCLNQFDRGFSYEEVAEFAPLFGEALELISAS